MNMQLQVDDDHFDDHVDEEIKRCLDKSSLKSFFTFAGAGSGKTRSLVKALSYLNSGSSDCIGYNLEAYSRQIAVITYTNAACDEILRRVDHRTVFAVSTIHSFLWELIRNQQRDIKKWVMENIISEIADLERQLLTGRGGATASNRMEKIMSKKERLHKIEKVYRFSYNPNGENVGHDSLNHAEVIKMGSEFILRSKTMQNILISKYPILLIDESQDTKKELVDALLSLYENNREKVVIGMFGDTMQRIYTDGKENLAQFIPSDWERPIKVMNHRSAIRIVKLANAIRKDIDGQCQKWRSDVEAGTIRLFLASSNADKTAVEKHIKEMMAGITGDGKWLSQKECISLILEHHMAACRLGFLELFTPLYNVDKFKTGILDGTLLEIRLFTQMVLPLINAYLSNDKFAAAKVVRQYSPLYSKAAFTMDGEKQVERLQKAEQAVKDLCKLWEDDRIPSCLEILSVIERNGLFEVPSRLKGLGGLQPKENDDEITLALHTALSTPFQQVQQYYAYINEETPFATHQGVKGLEYPRVVVIMDDEEAKGFLFSYEKLFGAKEKTKTDRENESAGKDSSITRTKRLFYVACTRAQKSLAIIAYTSDALAVKNTAIENKWFYEDEVVILP